MMHDMHDLQCLNAGITPGCYMLPLLPPCPPPPVAKGSRGLTAPPISRYRPSTHSPLIKGQSLVTFFDVILAPAPMSHRDAPSISSAQPLSRPSLPLCHSRLPPKTTF